MVKKTIVKFWCDGGCGNSMVKEQASQGYNYPEGWIKMNSIDIAGVIEQDMDFCSRKCLMNFIGDMTSKYDSGMPSEPKLNHNLPPIPPIMKDPRALDLEDRPHQPMSEEKPKRRGFFG